MSKDFQQLLDAAKQYNFTPDDKEEHRRSFAYGNTKIENGRITRQMIDRAADEISGAKKASDANLPANLPGR